MDYNLRVLLVDEPSSMRQITKNNLHQLGFTNVVEADDGTSALAKLLSEHIDFVVAGSDLPRMGGVDLTKAMRADSATKTTPVLLITSNSSPWAVVEAKRVGVSNYIVKPFTAQTLQRKLEEMFRYVS